MSKRTGKGVSEEDDEGPPLKRHGSRQTTDEVTATAEAVLKSADGACK